MYAAANDVHKKTDSESWRIQKFFLQGSQVHILTQKSELGCCEQILHGFLLVFCVLKLKVRTRDRWFKS